MRPALVLVALVCQPMVAAWLLHAIPQQQLITTRCAAKGCISVWVDPIRARILPAVMKQAVATATEVTEAQFARVFETFEAFSAAFDAFDLDGDGAITVEEIGAVMCRLGHDVTEEEVQAMVREFDNDNNGTIDFDEFCDLMTRRLSGADEGVKRVQEAAQEALRQAQEGV
jgi:hypothetical protein